MLLKNATFASLVSGLIQRAVRLYHEVMFIDKMQFTSQYDDKV